MRSVTAAVGQDLSINAPEWGLFMQVEFDVKIDAGALFDYMSSPGKAMPQSTTMISPPYS